MWDTTGYLGVALNVKSNNLEMCVSTRLNIPGFLAVVPEIRRIK